MRPIDDPFVPEAPGGGGGARVSARRPGREVDYYRGVGPAPYRPDQGAHDRPGRPVRRRPGALRGALLAGHPSVTIRSWATADPVDSSPPRPVSSPAAAPRGTTALPTTPGGLQTASDPRGWAAGAVGRRARGHRHAGRLRAPAAAETGVADQQLTTPSASRRQLRSAAAVADRVRHRPGKCQRRRRAGQGRSGQLRARARADGTAAQPRSIGRAGRPAADQRPLLPDRLQQARYFMADGGYLAALAQTQKLTGSQWE